MTQVLDNRKSKTFLSFFIGLMGISLIILIHESGHFFAAQWFNIPTPTFSIGFGPPVLQISIKKTLFQIALFPLGGYVEIDQKILAEQSYLRKIIVMLAGILCNIIFSFIIVFYYTQRKTNKIATIPSCLQYMSEQNNGKSGFIGPIGLIHLIGNSFIFNKHFFWLILSIVSCNIALFNLVPLPFLDGGKVFMFTLQALMGIDVSNTVISIVSLIFFCCFMIFMSFITVNDIKKLNNK